MTRRKAKDDEGLYTVKRLSKIFRRKSHSVVRLGQGYANLSSTWDVTL